MSVKPCMNNRRVRFVLKGQGQARHLLLVKSTLWGSCKFLLEHFKGNKVAWRHSPLSPLWSIRPAANEALTILCQWVIYEFDSVNPQRPWRKASFWKIDTCPIKIQCCFDKDYELGISRTLQYFIRGSHFFTMFCTMLVTKWILMQKVFVLF